jgi:hypothetical protein
MFNTPRQKLTAVNSKIGASRIAAQQDTTRVIYDTVSGAALTYGQFFNNFAGKNAFQTNLTTNKLDSMESMVINEIIIKAAAGTPFNRASMLNVFIGDDCVIKDFNLQYAQSIGWKEFPINDSNSSTFVSVPLLTSIVIPPQVAFKATLELSGGAVFGTNGIKMAFKGFGKIYKPNTSF